MPCQMPAVKEPEHLLAGQEATHHGLWQALTAAINGLLKAQLAVDSDAQALRYLLAEPLIIICHTSQSQLQS